MKKSEKGGVSLTISWDRLNLDEPMLHEKGGVRVTLEKSAGVGGKVRLVNTVQLYPARFLQSFNNEGGGVKIIIYKKF